MNRNTESLGIRARGLVRETKELKSKNPLVAVGPLKTAFDLVEKIGNHMIDMSDQIDALTPYLDEQEGQGSDANPRQLGEGS